ncbi:MAG: DUF447 family protein [Acetobacteraceae bacterium]|nr:DUF447 family protein [Acetobacteraceae bacterium]
MPYVREVILTTLSRKNEPHLAPIGLIAAGEDWIIAPFYPSQTLANLREVPEAVANYVDDVRIFAGCLTNRRDWPLFQATQVRPPRLAAALAHAELAVVSVEENPTRPRFHCRIVAEAMHRPFQGFNRAKAAVIEAAILLSRRHILPRAEIAQAIAHWRPLIEKTAGPEEQTAWDWLMDAFAEEEQANPDARPLPSAPGDGSPP